MTNFYDKKLLEKYIRSEKQGYLKAFLPLVIVIPLFVLFNFLAKTSTRVLYITLSSFLLSFYSINLVYNILENVIESKDKIKHFNQISGKEGKKIEGKVTSISLPLTLTRNVVINEISIVDKGVTHKLYLNTDTNFVLNENDNIQALVINNFIKECEVKNEK